MCRAHDKRPFYVQQMQIEEAPLCTDGDPMPGSACGGEGKGGRRGEERRVSVKGREGRRGRGVSGTECHHCLVGGGGTEKENQAILVLPGSYMREGPQGSLRGYGNW